MTRPTDVELMAYVDGELAPDDRRRIEAAVAADPELARRMEQHRRLRARVAGAYAGVLDEPAPERLAELIAGGGAVVRPAAWARRPRPMTWAAMAASLALGLALGLGSARLNAPPIAQDDGGLEARGVLAAALEEQAAADAGPVRIGLTFRNSEGEYCRTFRLASASVAGLACREADAWRVRATAEAPAGRPGEYRTAAAATPPLVLSAVDAIILGEPFDAQQEAAARARGWRD